MPRDNVTPFPGAGEPSAAHEALAALRKNKPLIVEQMRILAELHWARYGALRTCGFSRYQAFILTRTLFNG